MTNEVPVPSGAEMAVSPHEKMQFFADGLGSLDDVDIQIIVAMWSVTTMLVAFVLARWALRARIRAPRQVLILPTVVMTGLCMLSPWAQYRIAVAVRSIGVGSYGFIGYDVPGWCAPLLGIVTYAVAIVTGMKGTQHPAGGDAQ